MSESPRTCAKCGSCVQDEDRFCGSCGSPILMPPSQVEQDVLKEEEDSQRAGSAPHEEVPARDTVSNSRESNNTKGTIIHERKSNLSWIKDIARNILLPRNFLRQFKELRRAYRIVFTGVVVSTIIAFCVTCVALFWFQDHASFKEKLYINRVLSVQDTVSYAASSQEDLIYEYANGNEPNTARASANQALASAYYETAEEMEYPVGCGEHYQVWLEGIDSARMLAFIRGEFLFSGDESDLELESYYINEADRSFAESERILSEIRRWGC
jgi:hypothetical protein